MTTSNNNSRTTNAHSTGMSSILSTVGGFFTDSFGSVRNGSTNLLSMITGMSTRNKVLAATALVVGAGIMRRVRH